MADEEQLRILKQGPDAWNKWRQQAGRVIPVDLSGASLHNTSLHGADLSDGNLSQTNFTGADFTLANFSRANLNGANLGMASLRGVDFRGANLVAAVLSSAKLSRANFSGADLGGARLFYTDLCEADLSSATFDYAHLRMATLSQANFNEARFAGTVIANIDLSGCKNLGTIRHYGPSPVDVPTLQRSGPLPLAFLRGIGLPEKLIEYLPSILGEAIQHYSCFISYASRDEDFARRLHADLQDKGVRCWFAPEDMKIGAKIRDTLDQAIRLRDKVLLVLSEASIASDWVEDEVDKAFEEERQRGGVVLFPVRVDDAVLTTSQAWAAKLRRSRHVGDFRAWKEHDAYQRALERVLRDLRVETPPNAAPG